ncbi:thioredoxin family protein [Pedobacter sp. MC2016-14]|uniref:thioredoxin family protein n=1 Tax=Pedobacter sp. MC2016-14 TaxID=2897327 RepID=UPI001E3F44EF|nr:thioredoxin family protein [Pedobacter sp. MC2016-14]MCD0487787.1 thioredoxin family protein [Pedobacter sp. MC2016-14]
MKRLIIIALLLFSCGVYAQDGIQFYQGTWKETLAKAKAEKKLIFIDIYTSWCGPCKMMAKDIFPLKSIGDKFNTNFINYKIDAEKGEGITIAKTYKVNAYPTYLFVNGDGTLYYTTLGAMPEQAFIKEAENAIIEFGDPKPLPVWQAEYSTKKNDKEFLMAYMKKRAKLRLADDYLIDQYVSLASKEELLSKETLTFLLQQQGATVDGPFFSFLTANKAEVAKLMGQPETSVNRMLSQYAAGDLKRAVAGKDTKLLEKIIAVRTTLSPGSNAAIDADETRMSYYAQTRNEPELIKALYKYSKSLLAFDKNSIKEADAQQLKSFNESVAAGQMKDASPEQIEMSRKYVGSIAATNYAYRVRDMATAAYKRVNDKAVLNEALSWMSVAAAYSDNFTIPEVTAGLLYKLGRKDEALKSQQKAIDDFAAIKMDNEIITMRLKNRLRDMLDNKPVWIDNEAATVAAK